MSDIVWAVNPQRDTLRDLARRMRQHADEVFIQRDVDFVFDAPAQASVSESARMCAGTYC